MTIDNAMFILSPPKIIMCSTFLSEPESQNTHKSLLVVRERVVILPDVWSGDLQLRPT